MRNRTNRIRGFDWARAARECGVFGDFFHKTREIKNPELFGLYSAMQRIEGGAKLWRKLVVENHFIDNEHLAIVDWFNTVIVKDDNPWKRPLSQNAPDDPATQHFERFTSKGKPCSNSNLTRYDSSDILKKIV